MSVSGPGSDPYCVVSVGDSSGKTEVVKRNTSPTWGQTFRLFIRWGGGRGPGLWGEGPAIGRFGGQSKLQSVRSR